MKPGTGTKVAALCGGIGGAKLALGLYRVCDSENLTVVVNTGDDFRHLGLYVSPDVDTVLYTLSGLSDPMRGWGRGDETWNFMAALGNLGGETWFQLGDRDLALHVERTSWLASGGGLGAFTDRIARSLGIAARIVPMSDDPVETVIVTTDGELPFQHYFVRYRCEPAITGVRFTGVAKAKVQPDAIAALAGADVIVVCPSNPYLSVDPILAVPGFREALKEARAPVVAVSPLVGAKAVKGPTAKIMAELKVPATPEAIAAHYAGLIDGLVIDHSDAAAAGGLPVPVTATATLMETLSDRERLATDVLAFAATLVGRKHEAEAIA